MTPDPSADMQAKALIEDVGLNAEHPEIARNEAERISFEVSIALYRVLTHGVVKLIEVEPNKRERTKLMLFAYAGALRRIQMLDPVELTPLALAVLEMAINVLKQGGPL